MGEVPLQRDHFRFKSKKRMRSVQIEEKDDSGCRTGSTRFMRKSRKSVLLASLPLVPALHSLPLSLYFLSPPLSLFSLSLLNSQT